MNKVIAYAGAVRTPENPRSLDCARNQSVPLFFAPFA